MLNGIYKIQHERRGKILSEIVLKNIIPDVGANAFLDVVFNGATRPAFFIGLINAPISSGSIVVADTMGSHPAWTENIDYSESTRRAWVAADIGAGAWGNSFAATPAIFSVTGTASINGFFLASDSVKSGIAGILLSAVRTLPVIAALTGDTIRAQYTITQ
jgi:hypothetical protein